MGDQLDIFEAPKPKRARKAKAQPVSPCAARLGAELPAIRRAS